MADETAWDKIVGWVNQSKKAATTQPKKDSIPRATEDELYGTGMEQFVVPGNAKVMSFDTTYKMPKTYIDFGNQYANPLGKQEYGPRAADEMSKWLESSGRWRESLNNNESKAKQAWLHYLQEVEYDKYQTVRDALKGKRGSIYENPEASRDAHVFQPNTHGHSERIAGELKEVRKSAVASLGYDPRVISRSPLGVMYGNAQGTYDTRTDNIYHAATRDPAYDKGVITHESIHRGIDRLMKEDGYKYPDGIMSEAITTYLNQTIHGQEEESKHPDYHSEYKVPAGEEEKYAAAAREIEQRAAALIAKNRPGGPR